MAREVQPRYGEVQGDSNTTNRRREPDVCLSFARRDESSSGSDSDSPETARARETYSS